MHLVLTSTPGQNASRDWKTGRETPPLFMFTQTYQSSFFMYFSNIASYSVIKQFIALKINKQQLTTLRYTYVHVAITGIQRPVIAWFQVYLELHIERFISEWSVLYGATMERPV